MGGAHGLVPIGLNALDVARIEADFVLQGVDYIGAKSCLVDALIDTRRRGFGLDCRFGPELFRRSTAIRADDAVNVGLGWFEHLWEGLEEFVR